MRSSNPSPFFSFTFRVSDASTTFPLGPFGQHGQYSSVRFHKLRTHPFCIETLAPLPPPAGVTSKDASFDLGTAANRRAVWQWNILRYLPVE
jgi:hypothetical protein